MPRIVPDQRVQHSVNTYEKRLMRTFLDQVNARLRRVVNAGGLAPAVSAEAATVLERLVRAQRDAEFLEEVSQMTEPPTHLTMVLLKRWEYRAALEGFLEFRRTALVQLDEPKLVAPLANLAEFYETSGTLQVIQALLDVSVRSTGQYPTSG